MSTVMPARKPAADDASKPSPDESPTPPRSEERESAPEDLNSPEALARATAQLRALGVDDEVVFTARTPEELFAYLDRSCATST